MKDDLKYDLPKGQTDEEIAYQLSITPEQRIKEAVELIKRVYEFKEGGPKSRTIKILKFE